MDSNLKLVLQLSVPQMPPEVAWPLVAECEQYETLDAVPLATQELIVRYLPTGDTTVTKENVEGYVKRTLKRVWATLTGPT